MKIRILSVARLKIDGEFKRVPRGTVVKVDSGIGSGLVAAGSAEVIEYDPPGEGAGVSVLKSDDEPPLIEEQP